MRARTTMTGLALTAGLALSLATSRAGLGRRAERRPQDDVGRQPRGGHHQGRAAAGRGLLDAGADEERHPGRAPRSRPSKGKPGGSAGGGDRGRRRLRSRVRQGLLHHRQLQLRVLRHRDEQLQRRRGHHRGPLRQRGPGDVRHQLRVRARRTTTAPRPTAPGRPETLFTTTQWRNGERLRLRRRLRGDERERRGPEPDRASSAATRSRSTCRVGRPSRPTATRPPSPSTARRSGPAPDRRPGHLRRQPGPGPGLQHDRRLVRRWLDHRTAR